MDIFSLLQFPATFHGVNTCEYFLQHKFSSKFEGGLNKGWQDKWREGG